jgi:hypothetical protein
MAMDMFVVPRLFGLRRPMHRVAAWNELGTANWPAIIALILGTGLGGYTAGLIPGLPGYQTQYIGFPALQAWLLGAIAYLVGVAIVAHSPRVREILGYPQIGDATPAVQAQPASPAA